MTPQQLHILQHSLGVDRFGQGPQYRNHFCTGEGSLDHPDCMALVELGFMRRRATVEMFGGDDMFHVTADGVAAMMAKSPVPPDLTRAQKRYRRFLDLDSSMSFGEFLRSKYSREQGTPYDPR